MAEEKTFSVGVQTSSPKRISVTSNVSENPITASADTGLYYSQLAKNWAIGEGLIQNEDYSSKTWAGESKSSADLSKMYSEAASLDLNNLETKIIEYDEQLNTTITEGVETIETLQANSLAEITTNKESALSDIDISKTNTLAQISTLANTSISDINAVGKSYDNLTYRNITNCLLEIPQRIKYDLTDGILTIKAGSVVIVPYGITDLTSQYPVGATFLNDNFKVYDTQYADGKFFVWVELVGDISRPSFSENGNILIFVNINNVGSGANGLGQALSKNVGSGTSDPSTGYYYRTDENKVYHLGTWYGYSLPVMLGTSNGTILTSINQVFNGFGYIGSTIWVDKGVKGLIPNGRDEDGSFINKEITTNNLFMYTFNSVVYDGTIGLRGDLNGLTWYTTYQYDNLNNYNITSAGYWDAVPFATFSHDDNVITSFNPKQPFRITDNAVKKSGDTMTGNLTVEKDSWPIIYIKNSGQDRSVASSTDAGTQYLYLTDKNNATLGSVGIERYTNGRNTIKLQAFSKDGSTAPAVRVNAYANNTIGCDFPKCTTKATTTSSARRDLVAVVVENYVNGTSWRRVWSDGWIEQGGVVSMAKDANAAITFTKAFTTASYTVEVTVRARDVEDSCGCRCFLHRTLKTTGFTIGNRTVVNSSTGINAQWYACGY